MSTYDERNAAFEDAVRLLRLIHPDPPRTAGDVFLNTPRSAPAFDMFDVLSVARFLLDEEDTGPEAGACFAEAPRIGAGTAASAPTVCNLTAGHDGAHRSSDGCQWTPRATSDAGLSTVGALLLGLIAIPLLLLAFVVGGQSVICGHGGQQSYCQADR